MNLSISAIVFDPADTTYQTLVAGTGITTSGANEVPNASGLYYTSNGGSSWAPLGATIFFNNSVSDLIVNGDTILVGVSNGLFDGALYVSTDKGGSFTAASTGGVGQLAPGPISSMRRSQQSINTIYAAVSSVSPSPFENTALYQSSDNGSNWQPVFTQTQSPYISSSAQSTIKVATGPSGSVAVLVQRVPPASGPPLVVYLSLDSGSTWNSLDVTSIANDIQANYAKSSISIDAVNPNIVYITGSTTPAYPGASPGTVYSLTYSNGTTTIADLILGSDNSATHADTRMSFPLPLGDLIVLSDGGITLRTQARTNPAQGVWQGMNGQNLSTTEIYSSAYDGNSKRIMTSSQDNGTCVQSVQNLPSYAQIFPGDGLVSLINDQTSDSSSVYYFTMFNEPYPFKMISEDIPTYFLFLLEASTVAFASILNEQNSMFLNRKDPRWLAVLYNDTNNAINLGTGQDLGFAPTLISAGIITSFGPGAYGTEDNLQALALCAPGVGLYFTLDAQTTPLTLLPAYATQSSGNSPTGVVFDSRTYHRFFVTDSTSIYETKNTGTAFSGPLPSVPSTISPINALEFISNNGVNALLAIGYSTNPALGPIAVADCDNTGNLTDWRLFGLNLPNAYVINAVYNTKADLLLAGLWGRGAWTMYDVTSNFASATTLQFGLADNDSTPDTSILTGNRPLSKYGTGTLTISGTADFTGLSTIYEGTMVVNGSIPGGLLAQANGVLRGTGSIGGLVTIMANGTLAPGNSPGKLSVGSLTLQSGSLTDIQLEPTVSSEIAVAGTAILGGELHITQNSGIYTTPAKYTILTAGNEITTKFNSVSYSTTYSGFRFDVEYSPNYVRLFLNSYIPTENLKGNDLTFADYLNTAGLSSSALNLLAHLPESSLTKAVNAASPTRNAISTFTSGKTAFLMGDTLRTSRINEKFNHSSETVANYDFSQDTLLVSADDRIPAGSLVRGAQNVENNGLWINGFADFAHQDAQHQVPSFRFRTFGFLLGYDRFFEHGWVGAATGYTNTSIYQNHNLGNGEISSFILTPYGTVQFYNAYCELFLMGAYNPTEQKRHISFSDFDQTAHSHFHTWQLMPHVGFGYDYSRGFLTLEPYVGFDFLTTWQPAFREKGCPAFDVNQKNQTSFFLQSEIGLRFYQQWEGKYGICILRETGAYVSQLPIGVGTVNAALVGNSASVTLHSFNQNQNLFKLGLSGIVKWINGVFVSISVDGEIGSSYVSCEPQAKMGWLF